MTARASHQQQEQQTWDAKDETRRPQQDRDNPGIPQGWVDILLHYRLYEIKRVAVDVLPDLAGGMGGKTAGLNKGEGIQGEKPDT